MLIFNPIRKSRDALIWINQTNTGCVHEA